MNVHYLELFYYVAKFEGITPAVRKMPYGIQQPAVSAQLLKLEAELGVKLFHRRPFALTESGRLLYQFIEPFFGRLPKLAARLRGEDEFHLRLGASQSVLAHYLPLLLRQLRSRHPQLKLTLEQIGPTDAERHLLDERIDLAVTALHEKPAPGIRSEPLLSVPLVLLARSDQKVRNFSDLVKKVDNELLRLPLVSLSPEEAITQLFQKELDRRELRWTPQLVVNQLELVQVYAAEGFGFGLYAELPGVRLPKKLAKIPLDGFPKLTIGCLHRGHLNQIAQDLIEGARYVAGKLAQLKA